MTSENICYVVYLVALEVSGSGFAPGQLCNVTHPCRAIAGALEIRCRLLSFFPCLFSCDIFEVMKPAALQSPPLFAKTVLGEGLFVGFFFCPHKVEASCQSGTLLF